MLTTVNRVSKNKATLTGLDRDRKYITFDGVDGFATSGDSLKLGTGPFTLNAWISKSNSQVSMVYNVFTNFSNYVYFGWNISNQIVFNAKIGAGPFDANLTTINLSTKYRTLYDNVFHMITVTSDRAGNNGIYLNGIPVLDSGVCNSSDFDCGSDAANFGKIFSNCNPIDISEFSAYDVALSSADVKRMYNAGKSFNHLKWEYKRNCHSWYRFGDAKDNYQVINNMCANEPDMFDGKGGVVGTFNITANDVLDK